MKTLVATAITISLLAFGASALTAQSGNDLFQQALVKERTEGNPAAAIAIYQTIVDTHKTDRALVAKALVQMGQCYEKLGRADAIKTYERVVREFGDQAESLATARARLAALQSAAAVPAGPSTRLIWDDVDESDYNVGAPSADGRYLSFSGDGDELFVRDLREGTSHRLTTLGEKSGGIEAVAESLVCPDGRYVAYGWDGGPSFDLRILRVGRQPAEPRILHSSDETTYVVPVGCTPDGKSLLVLRTLRDRTGQIAFVSRVDGSLRVLKSPRGWDQLGKVSLSPDGRFIAYSGLAGPGLPAHDIFVLASDGSREAVVVSGPAADVEPVWSPDGSQILFRSNRTGNISLWTVHIADGRAMGPPELVRGEIGGLKGMTRSGALYYVTGGPTSNIYTVEVDANMRVTGAPVRATDRFVNGNTDPKWSRDGQSLAYRRGSVIVIRSMKTGEERVVLSELQAAQLTAWFPDGRSVLVLSRDVEQNRTGFHRLDVTNGRAEFLLSVKTDPLGIGFRRRPAMSPDGKSIFYIDQSKEPNKLLMRFDIDSRRNVELVRASSGEFREVAVSPDSAQLAYRDGEGLRVMPVGGGEPQKVLADSGGELAWTPDQRLLSGRFRFLALHPDGHRIAYRASENRPFELWALENFLRKPGAKK
jgi:Tol biopolymer transport system component